MIPRSVLSRYGYLYNGKNQSPILFEFWQHDVEDLMFQLSRCSDVLRYYGQSDHAASLDRHRQLLQGEVERHRDRGEWK